MSLWLLLEDTKIQGVTIPLKIGRFTYGPPQYNFDIKIEPDNNDDLYRSAQAGGGEAYRLLWREGYVRQSATGRFKLEQIPPHIHGSSGDLLFALALIVTALPRRQAYPPLAATGVVSDKGYVQSVQGIPAKIAAALKIMPEGGLIFYPRANEAEINADIISAAKDLNVELFPVDRLDQAAVKLGVSIRKIYLDAPYRGLQTFQYEHRSIYFGRQREIEVVRERLLDREALNNSGLLIVAASGAGKSSFVQAGLIPALEQGPHALADRPIIWSVWRPSDVLQTDNEIDISESIRNSWLQQASAKAQLIGLKQTTSLTELAEQLASVMPKQYRLMWLIDQFEELFTSGYSATTIKAFADFLMRLQQLGVWIVATLRGDFYGQYLQSPLFNCFGDLGVYHLRNLNPTALNQIITGPAELADISFEIDKNGDSLASLLLNDIGDRVDALPLLEFTLRKLYIARDTQQQMKLATYQHGGGLLGGIGQYAESIFTPLQQTTEAQLYRLLWAMTSSPKEQTDQQFTARPVLLDDFPPEDPLRSMIDVFTENRLLTLDQSQKDHKIRIRVAHDALLNHWERAKTIIEGFRKDKHLHDRLLEQAQRWQLAKQNNSLLLSAGLPLAEAEDLLQERRSLLDVSLITYIEASRLAENENRRQEIERIELEKVREQRAREQAELVAEQQTEIAEQRRLDVLKERKMNHRALLAFIILLGALGFAGGQWREADRQKNIAEQQMKVAEQRKKKLANTLTHSDFIQGVQFMQQDKPRQALTFLARAINTSNDENSIDLAVSIMTTDIPIAAVTIKLDGFSDFVKFSPGGRQIVITSSNTARIWDVTTGLPVSKTMRHLSSVRSAQFSPDGHRIVTASHDRTARIWDAETGLPVSKPMRHQEDVVSAQFSPDGRLIVTASGDNTARIWDAETGLPVSKPLSHQTFVSSAQFSPDGRRIMTVAGSIIVSVWSVETGLIISKPMNHKSFIGTAQFSPDGRRIVTASGDKAVTVWGVETGLPISKAIRHQGNVWFAQFSPEGRRIVTASGDKTARIWDAETGLPISKAMRHQDNVRSAQFSPDGRRILTTSWGGVAKVWDAETGLPISKAMRHQDNVQSAQFSPDCRRIVTASWSEVRVWDAVSSLPDSKPLLHQDDVWSARFSSDGRRIVTVSGDKTARIWDAVTGLPITKSIRYQDYIDSVQLSPDSQRLLMISNRTARLWDAETGLPVSKTLKYQQIGSPAFSPDSRRFLTFSNRTARVWDAETGLPVSKPMTSKKGIKHARFSRDGRRIMTILYDAVRIWDAETGNPVSMPMTHKYHVETAQFSHDGFRIVTGSTNNIAIVWDVEKGLPVSKPITHKRDVKYAQFSPDDRRIVTISLDRTVRVWDAQTGLPVSKPMTHKKDVKYAKFSPDSRQIMTVSEDEAVRVWDTESGLPVSKLIELTRQNSVRFIRFSPDGRRIVIIADDVAQVRDAETGLAVSKPVILQGSIRSVKFSSDGQLIILLLRDSEIWIQVQEIIHLANTGASFSELIEKISGYRINEFGSLEARQTKSKIELRRWLIQAKKLSPEAQKFINWLLSDPVERTVSHYSKLTVKQRVHQLIDFDTIQSLNKALNYWPGHPLTLAKLAAATLRESKPEQRKKEFPTISLWANLALRYAPNDQTVRDIAENVLTEIVSEQTATE